MTIFFTEFFKLDLSHLDIKFSEENTFFENDLIKQQSFPFRIPNERNFIPFFEFVSSDNSVESNKYVNGTLFRNDTYYDAELLILRISSQLEAVIYYNSQKLTIFDENLKDLPWSSIEIGDDIFGYAASIVVQNYPDTSVNFVQIYDPDRYKDYEFGDGEYSGYINHNVDGQFQRGVYDTGFGFSLTRINEMRPFIYLKEVLTFIFDQIGFSVTGDFVDDPSIGKCLLYHSNQIFYTNKDFSKKENTAFTLNQFGVSGYLPSYISYNEYVQQVWIYSYGTYKVEINIEGSFPSSLGGSFYLKCYFNGELLSTAVEHSSNEDTAVDFGRTIDFTFHVTKAQEGQLLEIKVICIESVKNSLVGDYQITGTTRPLYQNSIALKDLLPDITVGEFVASVKQTFNMTSVFDPSAKTVRFDFFNSFINNQTAIDLSKHMTNHVPRKMNKSIGYKIPFSDGEILNLNKKGQFVTQDTGFTEKRIPLEPLPTIYIDTEPDVKHQDGLSIFFFKATSDAKPLIIDGDIAYDRLGFVHKFLRNWFFQLLNSEQYNLTVHLPIFLSLKLNSESKIWFYNNYFLVHQINRSNINSLFEKLSLKVFKLKSFPTFSLNIDDDTDYENPTAFTTTSAISTILTTQFNAITTPGLSGNPSYFTIDIFGNQSLDPQDLPLSFGWEVLSSPDGNSSGIFQSQNTDHSMTRFTHSGYLNLEGDYSLRLTVVNTVGLSDSIEVVVSVSSFVPTRSISLIQLVEAPLIDDSIAEFQASLNFDPVDTKGLIEAQNVNVNFATGEVTPINSAVTLNVLNLSNGLNNFTLNLIPQTPSTSRYWYIKLIVDGVESNDRPFIEGTLPFNVI